MASNEVKAKKEEATAKALHDNFLAKSQGVVTDTIKCGKCGGKKTEYTQRQTRSADEPMTTFCTCLICGHRWRFC